MPNSINILIVDDEERNLTVLETILNESDYRIVRANSGDEALMALVGDEFALLILDIRMPGMTGIELAQIIKQRKRTASVPIIFLTAYYNEDQHVLEGYESGAVDYLHKPVNATILRSKVAVFAELNRKTRELAQANHTLHDEVRLRAHAEQQLRGLNETLELRVVNRTEALRRSEEKFKVIFNSTFQFIGLLDVEGRVLEVNRTALSTLRIEAKDVVGHPFWESSWWRSFPNDRKRVLNAVIQAASGEFVRFEAPYLLSDGTESTMDFSISPVFDESGRVILLVPEGRDITLIKRSERALMEADKRKDEFLATLAHELRNPLAPVRNAIAILGMQSQIHLAHPTQTERQLSVNLHTETETESETQWALKVIDRQIKQMTRLIDDLMDVSRINQGKIELKRERVLLDKILHDAVESSQPFLEKRGHTLSIALPTEPLALHADPVRLSQSFLNLLNNAAKYTESGGVIALSAERRGTHAVVSIKDSGIGIPVDRLESIFEMFNQVQSTMNRSDGGLGIGLSIVKRLVEMHSGSIVCQSDGTGHGSEFIVHLPLDDSPNQIVPTKPSNGLSSVSNLRILVVDDNRDAAGSLAMLLRSMGNEVQTAFDGEAAVVCAKHFAPDAVLCDIGLPNMNGYEACKLMKQEPKTKAVLYFAITGWGQEADRNKSRESGFDYHLVKPVDPQQIISLLSHSLPRKSNCG